MGHVWDNVKDISWPFHVIFVVATGFLGGLDRGMAKFAKLSVQVPHSVRERFMELDHGQKQLACTSGLLWYFNADRETQRRYRSWARAVADGEAKIDKPTPEVEALLDQAPTKSESRTTTKSRKSKKKSPGRGSC